MFLGDAPFEQSPPQHRAGIELDAHRFVALGVAVERTLLQFEDPLILRDRRRAEAFDRRIEFGVIDIVRACGAVEIVRRAVPSQV